MEFQSSSGVKFPDDWRSSLKERQPPKMIQWIMRYSGGLVQNEEQARWVLLGFVAVAVAVSLFLVFSGGGQEVSPEEIFRGTPSINE